jgi:UPF0716 protein FxsA
MRFLFWFLVISLVELATFFWVEDRIGLGWALGLALATAVLGSVLVRRAGLSVFGQVRIRLESGQLPGREITHGAAILVAGALLISPGFLTDAIGFVLLVPQVRDGIHALISRRIRGRLKVVDFSDQPEVIDVDPID